MVGVTSYGWAAIFLVLVMTSLATTQQQQEEEVEVEEQDKKAVVCYYASWAYYKKGIAKYTLDNVPVHLCTHLVYAFAVLDPHTYTTVQHDPWLDDSLGHYRDFVKLKERNPELKVLLGLGGWVDSRKDLKYSRLVSNPDLRRNFVSHLVNFVLRHGFDGVDLDWEFPGWEGVQSDKEGFTAWVQDLRAAFDPHDLLLTSSISAGLETIDRGYDIPAIAPHLDLMLLMSYDFHGNWEVDVGHPSPLLPQPGRHPHYNVQGAVDHLIKRGARPQQIVMGIPFYGVSWSLAQRGRTDPGSPAAGVGRPGPHYATEGKMAYYEVCLAKMEGGWQDIRGTGGSYMHKGDQWVAYDDTETLREKAEYAKARGLGGVMIWDVTTDDFGGYCGEGQNPLLTAVSSALQGTPAPPRPQTTPAPPPKPITPVEKVEIPQVHSRVDAGRDVTLSPCIVRFDGTMHCPWDFTGTTGSPTTTTGAPTTTPRRIEVKDATSEPHYPWQAWPVFSKTTSKPDIIPSHTTPSTPTTPSTTRPIPPTPRPTPRPTRPRFPHASAPSLVWFESCSALGFAADPNSCGSFYKCTNNFAYRFACPAGLMWRQDPGLCDWPWAVQCALPVTSPDLTPFLPPPSARFAT